MNYMVYFEGRETRFYYGPFNSAQAADKWARGSLDAGWVIRGMSEPYPMPRRGKPVQVKG